MTFSFCVWLLFFRPAPANSDDTMAELIKRASDSGRVLLLSESDSARLNPAPSVPPGMPPVLSFRFMDGARRHRFGDSDLMVDDAGH